MSTMMYCIISCRPSVTCDCDCEAGARTTRLTFALTRLPVRCTHCTRCRLSLSQASERFLLVQEAWETLRDADCREEYDCRVDLQAGDVVISDEVGDVLQQYVHTRTSSPLSYVPEYGYARRAWVMLLVLL